MFSIDYSLFYYFRTRLRKRYDDDTKDKKEFIDRSDLKIKKEITDTKMDINTVLANLSNDIETVTISDEEDGMQIKRMYKMLELGNLL